MKKDFAQKIYVQLEVSGRDRFLIVLENGIESADNGSEVAVYELIQTGVVTSPAKSLVPTTKARG